MYIQPTVYVHRYRPLVVGNLSCVLLVRRAQVARVDHVCYQT